MIELSTLWKLDFFPTAYAYASVKINQSCKKRGNILNRYKMGFVWIFQFLNHFMIESIKDTFKPGELKKERSILALECFCWG